MSRDPGWQGRAVEEVRGPHPDYHANLSRAEKFIKGVSTSLVEGMRVYIADSNELKRALLMICFIPPRAAKMGNLANPIFLHAPYSQVGRETEYYFNFLMKKAKMFWESKNIQLEIEDAICF